MRDWSRECLEFEGCHGEGWEWDLTDSGSGAQVYCDCPAGKRLAEADGNSLGMRLR
jgi:hypothetical protein